MGVSARVRSGPAGIVQVVVGAGTVPAGEWWEVTGAARGQSWPVRAGRGVSTGGQVVLADALAPINSEVTYTVVYPSGAASSAPVVRPWAGLGLLTDVVGGGAVDLLWQGEDQRDLDQRVTAHEVAGRPTPVLVFDPVMGAGTLSLTARTAGAATGAMLALRGRPVVVALFHNPAHCHQCRRGACDIDLVTVMALTSVSHKRTRRADVAERVWTLKGTLASVPEADRALGVSTWDDLDAARLTWDQVGALHLDWDGFDRTIWQEV